MLKLYFYEKADRSTFVELGDTYDKKFLTVGMHNFATAGNSFFLPEFNTERINDYGGLAKESIKAKNKSTLYIPEALVDTLWDDCLAEQLNGIGNWERPCLDSFFNVISITEGTGMFYIGGLEVSLYRPNPNIPAFSMFIRNPGSVNLLVNLQSSLGIERLVELINHSGAGLVVLDPTGYDPDYLNTLPKQYKESTVLIGLKNKSIIERYKRGGFFIAQGATEVLI